MNAQHLNDDQLIKQFEEARLTTFPHREHIRMAWVILTRRGWERGLEAIRGGLRDLAAAHGVPQKYHETVTCFWVQAVWQAMQSMPQASFNAFIEANQHLLDPDHILAYYSVDDLLNDMAFRAWVMP